MCRREPGAIVSSGPRGWSNGGTPRCQQALEGAIRQLEATKLRLQKARDEFGGHKAKAVEALGVAIEELRQALATVKK